MLMINYNVSGSNLIEIKYDGTTISFYYQNKIICVVVAGPYQEMINDYYISCEAPAEINFVGLDNVINSKEIKFYENYSNEIEAGLGCLEPGEYHLYHIGNKDFIKYQNNSSNQCQLITGTPLKVDTVIVCTKSTNELDRKKINSLKESIVNGGNPNIYLYSKNYRGLELDNYFFIIKGNHLLAAYEELHLEPNFLAVVNYQPLKDDYDKVDLKVIDIITSFKEVRDTSYKYFYN